MKRFFFCSLFLLLSFKVNGTDDLPWIKNGYPGLELHFVKPFLPENPVILEAGGHYGEDTVIFAQKWPLSIIYTFEPNPIYYSKLEMTTRDFPQIHSFPFGLFSKTGDYTFHVSSDWDGAASLLEDNYLPETIYHDFQMTVHCKNLDEWAENSHVDHIDYMWLDMEGTELHMLKSSPKILSTVKAISCELNHREFRKGMPHIDEFTTFLEEQGFTLYKIWGLQGDEPGTWQSTGVFIRSSLLKYYIQ